LIDYLAIAGEDFAVIAGDTRLTDGSYGINTRYAPKIWDVGDGILMTASGYSADADMLVKRVAQRIEVVLQDVFSCQWYHSAHNRPIALSSAARLIQTLLYRKRLFPYYVYTIVAGLDAEGKGAIYGFDPVGSYERLQSVAGGAASSLITPFLDNQALCFVI
jgi:20S proteasome subunit beta 6